MRIYRSPRLLRWLFPSVIWKGNDEHAVYLTFYDKAKAANKMFVSLQDVIDFLDKKAFTFKTF